MYPARTTSLPPALRLLAPAALAALYLSTRQHLFTIDSLYYLWDAEFAPWRDLLHPHHLALEPLLRGWWRLWQWFGWPERAVLPLQLLNVAVTLGALAVTARLIASLVRDRLVAAAWTLLVALSYATWTYATQAEGVPLYLLFAATNLSWAARLPRRAEPVGRRTAAAVAATIAGGVLIHQSLVLWAPPLAWMLGREAPAGKRWRLGAGTLASAGAAVLACYVAAGIWATGGAHPAELWRWFTGYSQEFAGRCGSLQLLFSSDVPRGLAATLLTGAPLKAYAYGDRLVDASFAAALVPFAIVGGLLVLGLARLPGAWKELAPAERRALGNVAVLVVVGGLFAGWWEPANRKFWTPVLPGLVALAAVGWARWPRRWPRLHLVLVTVALAAVFGYNLSGGILPRHRAHDARQPLLMFLARDVQPGDAVVLQEDRLWQCASYFRHQQTVHGLPGPNSDRDDPGHTVLQAAVADAARTLRTGATLYVAESEWPVLQRELVRELGPLPEPWEALRFGDRDLHGDEQVLLALRLPVG